MKGIFFEENKYSNGTKTFHDFTAKYGAIHGRKHSTVLPELEQSFTSLYGHMDSYYIGRIDLSREENHLNFLHHDPIGGMQRVKHPELLAVNVELSLIEGLAKENQNYTISHPADADFLVKKRLYSMGIEPGKVYTIQDYLSKLKTQKTFLEGLLGKK